MLWSARWFALLAAIALAVASSTGPTYLVILTTRAPEPLFAFNASDAHSFPQSFNPAWVAPSPATQLHAGMLLTVRSRTTWTPGVCPSQPHSPAASFAFARMLGVDGHTFASADIVFAPDAAAPVDESGGVEDARLVYDAHTQWYHLFYTCVGSVPDARILCHARTRDPTRPLASSSSSSSSWERLGAALQAEWQADSGAALLSNAAVPTPDAPHVLFFSGTKSSIGVAVSTDLQTFDVVDAHFIAPRAGYFDAERVAVAAPPSRLQDGNIFLVYNAGNASTFDTVGYAILNGTNPSQVLQRSDVPLMSLAHAWERGVAPAQCGTADTLFVTTVRKIPSCSQAFQLLFGGSDAVVGTATLSLKQVGARAANDAEC